MDVCIRTGFGNVHHNIDFQPMTEKKGKDLILSGHVREVQELRNNGVSYLIEAKVIRQTAVSATPYKTALHVIRYFFCILIFMIILLLMLYISKTIILLIDQSLSFHNSCRMYLRVQSE